MGCGKSKHDVATGNILTKIKKHSFRSVASSKSKKPAENDNNNVEDKEMEVKGGENLVDNVKGKEEAAEEKEKLGGALEAQHNPDKQTEHKVAAENDKPVVEKTLLQDTQTAQQNADGVIVEQEKPVEEKLLLQESKVEKEKGQWFSSIKTFYVCTNTINKLRLLFYLMKSIAEETIGVQEEKLVVIKEDKGDVKLEEDKATKDDNFAIKEQIEVVQLAEEKDVKDNLAAKKEVEVAKSVMVDEVKPPTETGKEENPATVKVTDEQSELVSF